MIRCGHCNKPLNGDEHWSGCPIPCSCADDERAIDEVAARVAAKNARREPLTRRREDLRAKVDAAYRCTECGAVMEDRRYSICDACEPPKPSYTEAYLEAFADSWLCSCGARNFEHIEECRVCDQRRECRCGCVHGDAGMSIEAQHRMALEYFSVEPAIPTRADVSAASRVGHIHDLSRPEVEVGVQIQDFDGDGL